MMVAVIHALASVVLYYTAHTAVTALCMHTQERCMGRSWKQNCIRGVTIASWHDSMHNHRRLHTQSTLSFSKHNVDVQVRSGPTSLIKALHLPKKHCRPVSTQQRHNRQLCSSQPGVIPGQVLPHVLGIHHRRAHQHSQQHHHHLHAGTLSCTLHPSHATPFHFNRNVTHAKAATSITDIILLLQSTRLAI